MKCKFGFHYLLIFMLLGLTTASISCTSYPAKKPVPSKNPGITKPADLPSSLKKTASYMQPVTVNTRYVQEKNQNLNMKLSIPVVYGLADKKYQSRINTDFAQAVLSKKAKIQQQAIDYNKAVMETGGPAHTGDFISTYKVTFNRNGILSITTSTYTFTGGAHGATENKSYNVNLSAQKSLSLADIFTSKIDYTGKINNLIKQQIDNKPQYFHDQGGFKSITRQQPFYLENQNLVVYFPQYAIAPYSTGIPEFRIPYSSFDDKVRKELTTR